MTFSQPLILRFKLQRYELLEYREDVENDHATDALRYSLPLELEEKPFLYVVRR